ncbi:MAG TPA: fused MFS/spermidine synthase [Thermoanaerobaculia bacterium]|nr:fused MFS/spermidine synthase [Thermoanaerobaculia bacterium]
MNRTTLKVAGFLFVSGMCALIYQTAWLRYFRLIFGASTLATGAVLAIFMGGLGAGSAILGRRADQKTQPLAFYGQLEIIIAISAAISPILLWLVRAAYIGIGGSVTLGVFFATIVRLLLSVIVIGVPTVMMGGTLPAAARAVESNDDAGRKRLALLYGANTLGAVTGAVLGTFLLLERFGNRETLIAAAIVNVLIGVLAWRIGSGEKKIDAPANEVPFRAAVLPPRLILSAAAIVGFAFLLMELVWYRMLSPLLGGTTFMFGLILAIALLGIGLGGLAWSLWGAGKSATAGGFALTCTLEAAAIAIPFALGDRLAILANALRPLGSTGFGGHVFGWTLLTMIVVFPAAFISGIQFPLLLSLLGRGRENVGREVGLAYAWNTGGAIAGSLLGGFGLLPLLTAPGCWKLVTALLAALGIVAVVFASKEKKFAAVAFSVIAAIASIAALFALGPTAVWRHSGIGAGRASLLSKPNEIHDWVTTVRRTLVWEADGRESSVALTDPDDLGLIVNGKSDGSARSDTGTQVMLGMIGALVHPNPKSTFIVGLGTGTSAGWIADVPAMERVDVVELEPAVVESSQQYVAVNRNVLANPKVHLIVADAREILLASRQRYDLIVSEPSNPYRAGVASLFTREFYEASAGRLSHGGIFLQWIQTYGVDARTVQTIYATITKVFPYVETWSTNPGDAVLVASREPIIHDTAMMRRRLTQEPYRTAAHVSWRVETLEGVYSRFLANGDLATAVAQQTQDLNTDNRPLIEFSFARTLGHDQFELQSVVLAARARNAARPRVNGAVDWNAVDAVGAHDDFASAVKNQDYAGALASWRAAPWQPANTGQLASLAHVLATNGDEAALPYIEQLRAWEPIEADAILGILRLRQRRIAEAAQLIQSALVRYRENPWPTRAVMEPAIAAAMDLSSEREVAPQMVSALSQTFAEHQMEEARRVAYVMSAARAGGCGVSTLQALQELEPNVPWRGPILQLRAACYTAAGLGERAAQAKRELDEFNAAEAPPLIR